jgi:hypothetical protein
MSPVPHRSIEAEALENSIPFMLGQIQGQLRELIHSSNNNGQKLEALSHRVAALEAKDQRRDGAVGMAQMVLKSPLIGWVVGAVSVIWAILTGRLHI